MSSSLLVRKGGGGGGGPPQRLHVATGAGAGNEKEEKIRSSQGECFRSMLLFLLLLVTIIGVMILIESNSAEGTINLNGITHEETVQHQQDVSPPPIVQQKQDILDQQREHHEARGITEEELIEQVDIFDKQVRERKATPGLIMETDPRGLQLTKQLQDVTRQLLIKRYGIHDTYRVEVNVIFPETVPDTSRHKGSTGTIVIEMAPIDLIPVSVFYFLEMARTWKQGAFHRNAGHVLQVSSVSGAHGGRTHMPFQEYSPSHPHAKGTTGYAGRPSGPGWYVSIMDNTRNHGPGSQQKHNPHEADANFGHVVQGMDDVVPRIHSIPQNGWLDEKYKIKIPSMKVLVPTGPNGSYEEWKESGG